MMKRKAFLITILILQANTFAQLNNQTHKQVYPAGINLDYGFGHYSVQDNFFSSEKYSGTLPYFKTGWTRFHDNRVFQLFLKYGNSSEIKNYQMAANVVQFSMEWDYLYPAGEFPLFSKPVFIYWGPYTEFYTYYNRLNFARDGVYLDFSFAPFFSLGIYPMFIMPIRKKLQLESSLQVNAFSVVIRMPELMDKGIDKKEDASLKLLTPFKGLNSQMNVGIRYYLFDKLSLKLWYEFHLTRISSWQYLLLANNNAIFTVTYHL